MKQHVTIAVSLAGFVCLGINFIPILFDHAILLSDLMNSFKKYFILSIVAIALVFIVKVCGIYIDKIPSVTSLIGLSPSNNFDKFFPFPIVLGTIALSQEDKKRDEKKSKKRLSTLAKYILYIIIGLITLWLFVPLARLFFRSEFLHRYNFWVCVFIVLVPLLTCLRRSFLKKQTWKKLKENWLAVPFTIGVLDVAFGFISHTEFNIQFLKMALSQCQLSISELVMVGAATLLCFGVAQLFGKIGISSAKAEDSQQPRSLFFVAFGAAWLSMLGFFTLFFEGLTLTILGNLTIS